MPFAIPAPIDTERLRVRLVAEDDLPALMAMNGDEAVTRFLPYATWKTPEDGKAWFERMRGIQATGTALQFVAAERGTNVAVGTCLLFRLDEPSARAELGYALARSHWGRGYMREALAGLISCAFGTLGIRRLEAEVDPRNEPSGRLLAALGFVREGRLRERWITKGVPTDVDVYGLLKDDRARAEARP